MKKFFMMFAAVIMAVALASCTKSPADQAAAAIEKMETAVKDKNVDDYCAALEALGASFTACKTAEEFDAVGKAAEKLQNATLDAASLSDEDKAKVEAAGVSMMKAMTEAATKFQKDAINDAKAAGGAEAEAAEALEDVVDEAAEEVEEAIDEATEGEEGEEE